MEKIRLDFDSVRRTMMDKLSTLPLFELRSGTRVNYELSITDVPGAVLRPSYVVRSHDSLVNVVDALVVEARKALAALNDQQNTDYLIQEQGELTDV